MTNKWQIRVPGRVNLIGEHIDYHQLPVLPMAIPHHITVDFERCAKAAVWAESERMGERAFELSVPLEPGPPGDWANYLKAAVCTVRKRWTLRNGVRATVNSNLLHAAGLSSSSALLAAFTLGLMKANSIEASLEELMSVLPEGEQFVGTRGGAMDHAAVLAAKQGYALLIHFAPFSAGHVPIPDNWRFLVAYSMVTAEKSGAAKAGFNACRTAGICALKQLGLANFATAGVEAASSLQGNERDAFLHVVGERARVMQAVEALRAADCKEFGRLLNASHASLRDRLRVSCPALDRIVEIAVQTGAEGARLTGAGFGGCALILCQPDTEAKIVAALERNFYAARPDYKRSHHLFTVQPANGALSDNGYC